MEKPLSNLLGEKKPRVVSQSLNNLLTMKKWNTFFYVLECIYSIWFYIISIYTAFPCHQCYTLLYSLVDPSKRLLKFHDEISDLYFSQMYFQAKSWKALKGHAFDEWLYSLRVHESSFLFKKHLYLYL